MKKLYPSTKYKKDLKRYANNPKKMDVLKDVLELLKNEQPIPAEYLPHMLHGQYKGCMEQADKAFVYFNPKVIEHKRLTPITAKEVKEAFGGTNVEVFTDSEKLQDKLRSLEYKNTALLMMSSGTFDGVNINEFAKELIHG